VEARRGLCVGRAPAGNHAAPPLLPTARRLTRRLPAARAGCRLWSSRCLRSFWRWQCCCAWRSRGAARKRLRSSWTASGPRSTRSASSGARCSTSSPFAPTCWRSRRACPAACPGAS
jgi:hypothetical protein